MFLDIDRFKLINDTYGHQEGDVLLKEFAQRVRGCLRSGDTLARQGGDEFTVLLPDINTPDDVFVIAKKIMSELRRPFSVGARDFVATASIGIAIYPEDGEASNILIRNADIAMYHVKGQGKNNHAFFEASMLAATYQKVVLEKNLRHALERHELEMYYQPHFDCLSGEIVGAEALMLASAPYPSTKALVEDLQLATKGRSVLTSHGLADLVQAQSLSRSTLLRSGVHQTVVQLDVQVSHHSPSF